MEWSLDTLKALIDANDLRYQQRFDAQQEAVNAALVSQEKAVAAALSAADRAVSKAELASEKRFESVNEFRGTLNDYTSNLVTRVEWSAGHQALVEKVEGLTNRLNMMEGRSRGIGSSMATVIAVVTIAVAIATAVIVLTR